MADVQNPQVDAKHAPVNVGASRVKFGNHGNHTILLWKLNPYVCNTDKSKVAPIV
jgi:hypothetical protein